MEIQQTKEAHYWHLVATMGDGTDIVKKETQKLEKEGKYGEENEKVYGIF